MGLNESGSIAPSAFKGGLALVAAALFGGPAGCIRPQEDPIGETVQVMIVKEMEEALQDQELAATKRDAQRQTERARVALRVQATLQKLAADRQATAEYRYRGDAALPLSEGRRNPTRDAEEEAPEAPARGTGRGGPDLP